MLWELAVSRVGWSPANLAIDGQGCAAHCGELGQAIGLWTLAISHQNKNNQRHEQNT